MKEFFKVSLVSREDIICLQEQGRIKATKKQIKALTDEQMERIGEKMGEAFTESGAYWDSLEWLANEFLKK